MNRAIVTSFDGNYFEYSMVLAKSFADNYNGERLLDFICLVPEELVPREREYIERVDASSKLRISFRSSSSYEALVGTGSYDFALIPYITRNALQRIFIASTLNEYDEVIYIDPDTVVVRDVDPLLNYPLRNKFLAVYDPDFINVRTFGTCDIPYFNNGVFITSLSYWRDQDIEGKMVRWLLEHGPTECIEQDLMNRFLIDVWSPLPMSFNSSPFSLARNDYTLTDPLIIHFVGPAKPWTIRRTALKYDGVWRGIYQSIREDNK